MNYEEIKASFKKYADKSWERVEKIRALQDSPDRETRRKFSVLSKKERMHYREIIKKQVQYERGIIGDEEAIEFLKGM